MMSRAEAQQAIALGDDALVLGHRLSQWSSRAPTLEEDIALSNLALDLIGQARLFYTLAGEMEGEGRSEDDFAYFRDASAFRNVILVELPNGDFAQTMMRQLFFAAFMHPYFAAMAEGSTRAGFRDIAAKAVKEMAYHVRHAGDWVIRLGDGTADSHRRTRAALDELWPATGELFEMDADEAGLVAEGVVPDRAMLLAPWQATLDRVLGEAGLARPDGDAHTLTGGRRGEHTAHLAPMLADMQSLARAHPGATW
jgi:ring-1,2-phenylacetyl-CoA epoxidase subunit PaaC